MKMQKDKNEKITVTRSQKIAVAVLAMVFLVAGIAIAGFFGDFSMSPSGVGGYFSQSTQGLSEAKESQTVELKNGATYNLTGSIVKKNINGHEVKMLAYNGMIPGPTIKVSQGAQVIIHFTNSIDVPTTLHSHGVRLDNAFDGVPDVTQKEIPPGSSFDYKIKFPDAGVYWYHPHVQEPYTQQLGMYGNYIVVPSDSNYWPKVNREVPLTLSDILIGQDGNPVPFLKSDTSHTLMGRFGNVMLTNGATDYELGIKKGEVVQFDLTNTANTRTFNFAIPGAKIKLVGGDSGRYERETFVDSVVIAPSERIIVDVYFPDSGTFPIEHKTPDHTYQLGNLTVAPDSAPVSYASAFSQLRTNADMVALADSLKTYFDKPADKKLKLTVDLGQNMNMNMGSGGSHAMSGGMMMTNGSMNMGGSDSKIEWEDSMAMMNSMANSSNVKWKIVDQDTGKANSDINWNFKVGDKIKISIYNDPNSTHPMQHPIHFHGQRFVVLSTNGVKNSNLVWKDTTLVQKGDTVEILLDASNPGTWMAHCHIAEHLSDGMMFMFKVTP
jgi:suppressor of ftsI